MATLGLELGSLLPNTKERRNYCVRKGRWPQKGCFKMQVMQPGLIVDREQCRVRDANLIKHCRSVNGDPFLSKKRTDRQKEEPISEKLDQWMKESVAEIVSHIGEAPFLVYVYSKKGSSTRLEREMAVAESWPCITKRWGNRSCCPDGVILVEELKDEDGQGEDVKENTDGKGSRSWGLLIQGRGIDCSACYILKTSRVCSSSGFCTHFCLVRAKCFGDPAQVQLRDSWLQMQ